MNRKMIIDAYCRIREIDNTIPDDVLDFMKDAALEKLKSFETKSHIPEFGTKEWVEACESFFGADIRFIRK